MTTKLAGEKHTTKRPSSRSDDKLRVAFKDLCRQATEKDKAERAERQAAELARFRGAAKRFKGLSEGLQTQLELRNIYITDAGCKVIFQRDGETFTRDFRGGTEEKLAAAIEFRDEALKLLGESARKSVPDRVLKALGLPAPVPGILRHRAESVYVVRGKDGTRHRFSYRHLAEEDAYAAAIACLEADLASK
jgi:hypothetical protein